MKMISFFTVVTAVSLMGVMAQAAEAMSVPQAVQALSAAETNGAVWMTDFEAAKAKAKAEKKHLLLDFTGSDWCGWCIRLDKEVFSQKEFQEFAAANLILVKLDFPRNKSQSDAVKAQNQRLSELYGIEGFPTILILNSNGKLVEQAGYRQGGAAAYVKFLKGVLGASPK